MPLEYFFWKIPQNIFHAKFLTACVIFFFFFYLHQQCCIYSEDMLLCLSNFHNTHIVLSVCLERKWSLNKKKNLTSIASSTDYGKTTKQHLLWKSLLLTFFQQKLSWYLSWNGLFFFLFFARQAWQVTRPFPSLSWQITLSASRQTTISSSLKSTR